MSSLITMINFKDVYFKVGTNFKVQEETADVGLYKVHICFDNISISDCRKDGNLRW